MCTFIGIVFGADVDDEDVVRTALLFVPPSLLDGNWVMARTDLLIAKTDAKYVDMSISSWGRSSSLAPRIMVES